MTQKNTPSLTLKQQKSNQEKPFAAKMTRNVDAEITELTNRLAIANERLGDSNLIVWASLRVRTEFNREVSNLKRRLRGALKKQGELAKVSI
jgi:hypothetical protein